MIQVCVLSMQDFRPIQQAAGPEQQEEKESICNIKLERKAITREDPERIAKRSILTGLSKLEQESRE